MHKGFTKIFFFAVVHVGHPKLKSTTLCRKRTHFSRKCWTKNICMPPSREGGSWSSASPYQSTVNIEMSVQLARRPVPPFTELALKTPSCINYVTDKISAHWTSGNSWNSYVSHLKGRSSLWTTCWCVFKLLDVFDESSHLKGRSSLWTTCRCFFKLPDVLKATEQISHLKGRSSLWTRRCCFNLLDVLRASEQISHLKGHSSLCVWWCWFKSQDLLKATVQISHLKARSLLWTCWCLFKLLDCLKANEQISHLKGRSSLWTRRCRFK